MINKEESIKKYFDIYLQKKWSVIYDPKSRSNWIIDVGNKYWIIELEENGKCWMRFQFIEELSMLYDIKTEKISTIIMPLIEELFNITITEIRRHRMISLPSKVDDVIDNGNFLSKNYLNENNSITDNLFDLISKFIHIKFPKKNIFYHNNNIWCFTNNEEPFCIIDIPHKDIFLTGKLFHDITNTFQIDDNLNSDFIIKYIENWFNLKSGYTMQIDSQEEMNSYLEDEYGDFNLFKNVINETVGDIGSPNLKYYAFDWDDNVVIMPTRVIVIDNNSKEIGMTTQDFAKFRSIIGKEEFQYKGKTILGFAENPFRNFRTIGDKNFIIDAMLASVGPSWPDFLECINSASIFAIITARGHSPETLKQAVYNYIISNFNGINKNELVRNIKKYRDINDEQDMDDVDLIREYLNLCKFYPCSFDEGNEIEPEVAKTKALKEFLEYAKTMSNKLNEKILVKNNIKNYFTPVVGFSDDDISNINSMKSEFKNDPEIKTFYTGKGKKEEY